MESPSPQTEVEPTPEAYIVGDDFIPGAHANFEIDLMLGHSTVLCGDRAIRGDGKYEIAPNYCGSEDLIRPILKLAGTDPILMKTADRRKKPSSDFTPLHVAMFAIGDDIYLTKPQETQVLALACVAWYLLSI